MKLLVILMSAFVVLADLKAVTQTRERRTTSFDPSKRSGTKLKITHPSSLANKYVDGLIKSSLGNFGHIKYGQTIHANVYYPEDNQNGCKPFSSMFSQRFMVLVDAGKCTITTKVRNI